GARPVTAAAAHRAGLAWPRLPAAAELATIGAGYGAYALVRLAIRAGRHAAFGHAAWLWRGAGGAEPALHAPLQPHPTHHPRPPRPRLVDVVLLRACPLPCPRASPGLAVCAQAGGVRPAAVGAGAGHGRRERRVLGLASCPAPVLGAGDDRHLGHPRHSRRGPPTPRRQPGEPLRRAAQLAPRPGCL